jgi:DNA-binding response OmpR family regulator
MSMIVVVEEDAAMRTLFCEWLTGAGYTVRGRSARGASAEPGVDLVVVDLGNIHAQGALTAQLARSIYPGAALVGTSAQLSRTLPGDSSRARTFGVDRLVAKPCSRDELVTAVNEIIGPPSP